MRKKVVLSLFAILLLSCLAASTTFGQSVATDSVQTGNQEQSVGNPPRLHRDSIQSILRNDVDSVQSVYDRKINQLDSIGNKLQRNNIVVRSTRNIDSLESEFRQRSDSLKNAYKSKVSKLDAAQASVQKKLDSLTTLNLPANDVTKKLDSLNKLRESTIAYFDKKLASIKDQTSEKLKKLDLPPEATDKLNPIMEKVDTDSFSSNLNNPLSNVKGNIPDEVSNLTKTNTPVQVPGISENTNVVDLPQANQLPQVGSDKITNVPDVTDQVNEYSKEAEQLTGKASEVKNIPQAAEDKAAELSHIKEMEQQTKGLDQYKSIADKGRDQEALKKEAMEQAKKVAVDHFAGKQEQLKAAMEKISKYKKKYSSLNGIQELSKKPRNEMRDKPLIERVVPGIALQFQKRGEDLLLDLNPYAAYRFTKRLSAGLGWNQRIAYATKQTAFKSFAQIYGPRAFGEFQLGKGFSPRAEIELMNTAIPPLPSTTYDPFKREWVWGAFAGMKKQYKLFKNVKGTAMIMARLVNPGNKSPYADIVNVRFGFEFPMKKKVKESD